MVKLKGKVKIGQKRGQSLGFPTANINVSKKIDEGIYISTAKIGQKLYPALTFIGINITFNETKLQAETYILDFSKNIYNNWINLTLIKKIRDNKKFDKVEDLVKAMENDEKVAREYFNNHEHKNINY